MDIKIDKTVENIKRLQHNLHDDLEKQTTESRNNQGEKTSTAPVMIDDNGASSTILESVIGVGIGVTVIGILTTFFRN